MTKGTTRLCKASSLLHEIDHDIDCQSSITLALAAINTLTPSLPQQSSGAVWKSRWRCWAPVPNKPTVSVDVKTTTLQPTVPTSQIARLKSSHTGPQTIYFPVIIIITNLLWVLCVLGKILSDANAKKKNAWKFQMSHFCWSFSSDVVAVKWLIMYSTDSEFSWHERSAVWASERECHAVNKREVFSLQNGLYECKKFLCLIHSRRRDPMNSKETRRPFA